MLGKTLLHYKVLEELGRGGMGVVYKAEDINLKRFVALKFLPSYVETSNEDIARFNQEAQAAAVLNHPNICTIHAIEKEDDYQFIVMELIDGVTLSRKIENSKLKVEDAVSYAIQIGEALQEAHLNGIVHRDIKCENIMVNSKNQIKVMDFGLAKLKGSLKLTKSSSTVGTLAYMAPEQIQGAEIDERSDIFSFGVVLFEMLTGQLPFYGEHDASIMYSILNEEPRDINSIVENLSPIVVNLIQRCLEKDPADRYQTMQEVLIDLGRAKKKTGSVIRSSTQSFNKNRGNDIEEYSTADRKNRQSNVIKKRIFAAGFGVILIVIALLLVNLFLGSSLPKINPNRSVSTLQIPVGEVSYSGISPDGKMLAIAGSKGDGYWSIYLMDINSGETKRLTAPSKSSPYIVYPQFSPDGNTIAFGKVNKGTKMPEICEISILGGLTKVIADTGTSPHWDPSGKRIFYFRGIKQVPSRSGFREYWSISPDGSNNKLEFVDSLAHKTVENINVAMSISPDEKKMAFLRPFKGNFNEIIVRNLKTGKERRLTYDRKLIDELLWLKNGYILYSSNRNGNFNIWAIPGIGGKSKQITSGTGPDFGITMSTSANRLVYFRRSFMGTLWMVNEDGSDNRQIFSDESILDAGYSADKNKIALMILHQYQSSTSLVMRDLKNGQQEVLVPPDTNTIRYYPQWSPSGSEISYEEYSLNNSKGTPRIKVFDITTSNKPKDFGPGMLYRWASDSIAYIVQQDSLKGKIPSGTPLRLNVKTGERTKFFRDSAIVAMPVLNGSKYVYVRNANTKNIRIISKNELLKNPLAKGKLLVNGSKVNRIGLSNKWIYYSTSNAIWEISLNTLKKNKILDFPKGTNITVCLSPYNSKSVPYIKTRTKTKLIKVDNLFIK
jgi:serine/threonine protein kinase